MFYVPADLQIPPTTCNNCTLHSNIPIITPIIPPYIHNPPKSKVDEDHLKKNKRPEILTNKRIVTQEGHSYTIGNVLGKGAFGMVYDAITHSFSRMNMHVACKIENQETKQLIKEFSIYRKLNILQSHNFPKVFEMAQIQIDQRWYHIMFMEKLGECLDNAKDKRYVNGMPLKYVCVIGKQMIQCLQQIHKIGVLHRDIAPRNIMLRYGYTVESLLNEGCSVYLIDFGLAEGFITANGMHRPYIRSLEINTSVVGTPRYCSKRAHRKCEKKLKQF